MSRSDSTRVHLLSFVLSEFKMVTYVGISINRGFESKCEKGSRCTQQNRVKGGRTTTNEPAMAISAP